MDYEKIEQSEKRRRILGKGVTYLFLTIWALIVLFPFYWMLLTSVKSYGAYNAEHIPAFFTASPTLENYKDAFTAVPLAKYLLNTLVFTVITTAIMMVVITLAAYAFARLSFRGKNLVFTLFLSLMMIPAELVVITNFVTITNLNLRNTFTGLILPSVTSVFYIYLLKENFEQVPDELYRAAKVDGTSDLKFLCKVMIPICKPTMVTIVILKVIECWNSYVWPRLITDDPNLLSRFQRNPGDPGKRLRPGKHSCHDGGGGGHFPAPYRSVSGFPEPDHGRGIERRAQKDEKQMEKISGGRPSHSRCAFPLRAATGRRKTKSLRASGYL